MSFETFCAGIAAYTDMYESGFISEHAYNRNIKKFWNLVQKLSI